MSYSNRPDTDRSAINLDRLSYRTMSWRTIVISLILGIVVLTALNIKVDRTTAIVFVPFLSVFFGWQMGLVSERNEWHKEEGSDDNRAN